MKNLILLATLVFSLNSFAREQIECVNNFDGTYSLTVFTINENTGLPVVGMVANTWTEDYKSICMQEASSQVRPQIDNRGYLVDATTKCIQDAKEGDLAYLVESMVNKETGLIVQYIIKKAFTGIKQCQSHLY